MISCVTTIGFGSPNKSGKASAHGSPLGKDEVNLVRKKFKWDHEPFEIPQDILDSWKLIGLKGKKLELEWNKKYSKNKKRIDKEFNPQLKKIFDNQKNVSIKNLESVATRKSSERILTELIKKNKLIIGGSADLAGSNNTKTIHHTPIKKNNFKGNYIHYGVREHAMAGIMNGIALHSGLIPYGGTFNF